MKPENLSFEDLIYIMKKDIEERSNGIEYSLERETSLSKLQKRNMKRKLKKLEELNGKLIFFENSKSLIEDNKYKMSIELNQSFKNLVSVLSLKHQRKLKQAIKNDIKAYEQKTNSRDIESLNRDLYIIKKLVNSLRLNHKHQDYIINRERRIGGFSYKESLEAIDEKVTELLIPNYSIDYSPERNLESFGLSGALAKYALVRSGKLSPYSLKNFSVDDKKYNDIVNNFDDIKKAFLTKAKLAYTQEKIKEVINMLGSNNFSETRKYLEMLSKTAEKELKKIDRYLKRFDFEHLEYLYKKDEEEKAYDETLRSYKSLSYQLEEAKANGNKERVKQLENQMDQVARSGKVPYRMLESVSLDAKLQFSDDTTTKEAEKKINLESQKRKDYDGMAQAYIRYLALQKDKGRAMRFSEFAQTKYNQLVTEGMISEELRDEIDKARKGPGL